MLQLDINPIVVKLQNYTAHPHKLASPCHPRLPHHPGSTHALWQEDQTAEWTEARQSYIFQVKMGDSGREVVSIKEKKKEEKKEKKVWGVDKRQRVEPRKTSCAGLDLHSENPAQLLQSRWISLSTNTLHINEEKLIPLKLLQLLCFKMLKSH